MVPEVEQRLHAWVAAGLISPQQASAIAAHEQSAATDAPGGHAAPATAAQESRSSAVAEAVGYLGAALILIAGSLIVGQFWEQIRPWGRLALTATLSLVLFAAGWALRRSDSPPLQRLTSVLWFATAVGAAFTIGLGVGEQLGEGDGVDALLVTAGTAMVAALLYALRQSAMQLIALGGSVAATAVAALTVPRAEVDPLFFGLVLWALGIAWVLLSATGWLRPARTGQALGLIGILVGAEMATFGDHTAIGLTIGLMSTAALLAISVAARSTLVLGFAVAGIFIVVPHAVFHFFGDSLGAPFALLLTGLVLVGAAVGLVKLRREISEDEPEPATRTGSDAGAVT